MQAYAQQKQPPGSSHPPMSYLKGAAAAAPLLLCFAMPGSIQLRQQ